jgi:outer membrane protein assembly factor BamD
MPKLITSNLILTLLLAAGLLLPSVSNAAIIYRSDEGWSIEGDEGSTLEKTAADQMHRAEQLEHEGKDDAAVKAYQALIKHFSLSVLAPKAQQKVGNLLERQTHYEGAFDAYHKYLTKYPKGDDFDAVVDSMFKIAKLFLDGAKRRVFGVPIASSMQKAQEMFADIVKDAPYSKVAPLAQFNVGQALEKQNDLPNAIAAYQKVVADYTNDPVAESALYQIGYVRQRQFREGSYDKNDAQKAREAFDEFINRYPQSERAAQARDNIASLETGQTKNLLQVAKFYDKTKQYKAAVIYYNDVIKSQPGTPDSDYAKQRIDTLKEQVGPDVLQAGPEKVETGAKALERRKLQAKVDTVSRADYVGPPVKIAEAPVETAPDKPHLRTSPASVGPVPAVEPPLPAQPAPLKPDTGLPIPPP